MKKIILTSLIGIFGYCITAQMVLEFNTNISDSTEITLPLNGTVSVAVDWGDGNVEVFDSPGDVNHVYDTNNIYTVTINGTLTWFGKYSWQPYSNADKLIRVTSFGNIGLTSLEGAFRSAYNLVEVPDTLPSTVTILGNTFRATNLFNQDISSWDVSNVTDMNSLFFDAKAFNRDIGVWDVSNVTNMSHMFYRANVFNRDISEWDVSNVTDMGNMFTHAFKFNQNIGKWNVSKVTNMEYMFSYAIAFDQNIGDWNVSSVTNLNYMFDGARLSTANYNHLLIGWATLTLKPDLSFNGGYSTYSPGNADTSRQYLINNYTWTIKDVGISYLPVPITDTVSEITLTTAISGGCISNDGGDTITSQGVVWDTEPDPTIESYSGITLDEDDMGSFISNITGLIPGTNYYIRSYATNINGTGYGNTFEFTTIPKIILTISGTFSVSDKIFDGTTDAVIESNDLTLAGVNEGDTVELTDVIVAFSNPGIGNDVDVNIISANLSGCDTVFYSLSLSGAPVTTANILSNGSAVDKTIIKKINIYPNPFNDKLNLENTTDISNIELIDITGQKLPEKYLGENMFIETTNLPDGIYFLRLEYKNGTYQIEKVIKKSIK